MQALMPGLLLRDSQTVQIDLLHSRRMAVLISLLINTAAQNELTVSQRHLWVPTQFTHGIGLVYQNLCQLTKLFFA